MLARIQQVIALIALLSMAGSMTFAIVTSAFAPAISIIVIGLAGYAGALGLEFAWLLQSYARDDPMRPSPGQIFRSLGREICAAPRVFLWRQPFRSRAQADNVSSAIGATGVVFVHGFFCNRGIWNPWMNALRAQNVAFVAVNLEPVFASMDAYVPRIEAAIDRLERSTGRAPVVVAHSMGGLAARVWAARAQGASRIHRLVTIATPHAGTVMARHSHFVNGRQMRIGSPWLAALGRAEDPAIAARCTCFWSHCDNIVFPTRNATLPGADNRHLAETPHVAMVNHPAIFGEVARLLGLPASESSPT